MCDDAGISDTKVRVFYFESEVFAPHQLVFRDLDTIYEWIKADMDDAAENEKYEYSVSTGYMTEAQLERLEEWDG